MRPSPYFVVCGSRNTVRDGDEVELRPSVAPWIRRICGKCIGRFGVRSAYATASNPKNDASVHTPTHTAAKLPPATSVPLLKSRAVLAEAPPAGSVYFDARPRVLFWLAGASTMCNVSGVVPLWFLRSPDWVTRTRR